MIVEDFKIPLKVNGRTYRVTRLKSKLRKFLASKGIVSRVDMEGQAKLVVTIM